VTCKCEGSSSERLLGERSELGADKTRTAIGAQLRLNRSSANQTDSTATGEDRSLCFTRSGLDFGLDQLPVGLRKTPPHAFHPNRSPSDLGPLRRVGERFAPFAGREPIQCPRNRWTLASFAAYRENKGVLRRTPRKLGKKLEMLDDQNKQFISDTRKKAELVSNSAHISSDIKDIIKDLLVIADNFESLMSQSVGQSADSRVLKKKLDQSKLELNQVKKALAAIAGEIKTIGLESGNIIKSPATAVEAANKIKSAIQKIAETVVKVTTTPSPN
jgi:hypothetical protein